MAIHLNKSIIVEIKSSDRVKLKRLTKYLHTCDKCNVERGFYIKTFEKQTKHKGLCRSCAALNAPPKTDIMRQKLSIFRTGKSFNKGMHHSEETKQKIRESALKRTKESRLGHLHHNKSKIKMSCSRRKINLIDFDGFLTKEDESQRRLFKSQGLHYKCFENANYCCDCCGLKRTNKNTLNAHHLDGWNWAKDKRLELANLVSLCEKCHESFHNKFGRGNNTKEQYLEFKWQSKK